MSYPINYPTPQGANVQIFWGGDIQNSSSGTRDWVKPQGASFVWFTLIGAGGGGGGSCYSTGDSLLYFGGGGASGNVTNFMCPAFLMPDQLKIRIGNGGNGGGSGPDNSTGTAGTAGQSTEVLYQQKNNLGYQLLIASGGGAGGAASGGLASQGTAGAATAANTGGPMTAAGFYNAIAGQNGATGNNPNNNPDNLTFLNGGIGAYSPTSTVNGNYGYTASRLNGYAQISPIIISLAGSNPTGVTSPKNRASPFGSGGNGGGDDTDSSITASNTSGTRGGDGLAIIVTW
jgi:hypothetical protein